MYFPYIQSRHKNEISHDKNLARNPQEAADDSYDSGTPEQICIAFDTRQLMTTAHCYPSHIVAGCLGVTFLLVNQHTIRIYLAREVAALIFGSERTQN